MTGGPKRNVRFSVAPEGETPNTHKKCLGSLEGFPFLHSFRLLSPSLRGT